MMKRTSIIILLNFIFVFVLGNFTYAFGKERDNIAVINLNPQGISENTAIIVSEFLRHYLLKINKFNVLEREMMEEIIKEQKFQLSGCTTEECAVKVGALLNVEKIVVGSISKLGDKYYITARLVDVESGKVDNSQKLSCSFENELEINCKILASRLSSEKTYEVEKSLDTIEYLKKADKIYRAAQINSLSAQLDFYILSPFLSAT